MSFLNESADGFGDPAALLDHGKKGPWAKRLGAVAHRFLWTNVHFNKEPVGTGGNGRSGNGGHKVRSSHRVTGVDDYREMCELF